VMNPSSKHAEGPFDGWSSATGKKTVLCWKIFAFHVGKDLIIWSLELEDSAAQHTSRMGCADSSPAASGDPSQASAGKLYHQCLRTAEERRLASAPKSQRFFLLALPAIVLTLGCREDPCLNRQVYLNEPVSYCVTLAAVLLATSRVRWPD
jgi:hypothetical protein